MGAGGAGGRWAGAEAGGARRVDFPDRGIAVPPFVLGWSKNRFSFTVREGRPPSKCSGSGYLTGLPMTETLPTSALDTLLATLRPDGCTATAHIDDGWMQGRTAYGGISSAVALAATMALHPTDTPLRYAQISFVGPVGGDCTVTTRELRRSKSSLFVDAGVASRSEEHTSELQSL